jgi:hypothetical protein
VVTTLRFRVAVLAIGVVWIGSRIVYWNGYYTEDSPGYVTDAIWMALGDYHARDHVNGLNVGTYLPVALPVWIFGKSEVALGLWPLSCSLLGLVSVAGVSRIFLDRPFNLLAAFLYATYPGDVFFSTVVMPDALQAGWFSFSLFLLAGAYLRPAARHRLILAAAGLGMGACHLIRANDVLLVPVGVGAVASCAVIWKRKRVAAAAVDCGAYLAGWVSVIAVEGFAYAWASHDFFHRFHVVTRHYGTLDSIARAGLNTDARTIPFSLFAPLRWWVHGGWGELSPEQAYHGLLFCWAAASLSIGAVALIISRGQSDRRVVAGFAVAIVWVLWPLLYHQFGSQSLTQFVPMHRLSRHLVVYAPGAVFAIVAGCALVIDAMRTSGVTRARGPLMAVGVLLLLTQTYFNWRAEQIAYGAFHRIKDTYARIRERLPRDVRTLSADPGDLCFFDFWMNPLGSERVRMVPFSAYQNCEQIRDGVVLTQSNPGWQGGAWIIRETVTRLPCLTHPPATWRLVYQGYPEKVFQIDSKERDARE